MSDPVSLAPLFDAAEQAALSGDFAAAARLLGEAARAQEAALGPDHLDLANTLNNLAVAHERCGQLDAAEREYRRAHAIAARTRPADDPLVTTSAQNLREFCEANGRPVDVPPSAMTLADDIPPPGHRRRPHGQAAGASRRADRAAADHASTAEPAPARPRPGSAAARAASARRRPPGRNRRRRRRPSRHLRLPRPRPRRPPRRRTRRGAASRFRSLVALGAIAALVLWLLAGRGPAAPPGDTAAAASDTPPDAALRPQPRIRRRACAPSPQPRSRQPRWPRRTRPPAPSSRAAPPERPPPRRRAA